MILSNYSSLTLDCPWKTYSARYEAAWISKLHQYSFSHTLLLCMLLLLLLLEKIMMYLVTVQCNIITGHSYTSHVTPLCLTPLFSPSLSSRAPHSPLPFLPQAHLFTTPPSLHVPAHHQADPRNEHSEVDNECIFTNTNYRSSLVGYRWSCQRAQCETDEERNEENKHHVYHFTTW